MDSTPPILNQLQQKLGHLSQKQAQTAANLANIDTPGYIPKTIPDADFKKRVAASSSLYTTHARHIDPDKGEGQKMAARERENLIDIKPNGNAVSLEQELIDMNKTSNEYQAAIGTYQKMLRLMKLPVERGGG